MRTPEFWTSDTSLAKLARSSLSPFGWLYGASVAWRAAHEHPKQVSAKVVCVGNLTAGGTGKTPVAIAIANALRERGASPSFLSRGYGGRIAGPLIVDPDRHLADDVGDEPLLLARAAPTIVARDRFAGAQLAVAEGADVVVMDDGHQNFRLKKDLSIVVIDANLPFGNGLLLPAGPLREPVRQGLERADAIVLIGTGEPAIADVPVPVLRARIVPAPPSDFRGARILAFAGIGQPQRFFDALRSLGVEHVDCRRFADHHAYTASEIARLRSAARSKAARLVTTEKDFVRLTPAEREGIETLPVRAVFEDDNALSGLLEVLDLKSDRLP